MGNDTLPRNPDRAHDAVSDELLATRCQLGEARAFNELIARWHEPLWRYIRRATGEDDAAAELVQETWLRVLRAMPRLRSPDRLRAWLFGIARRTVMDHFRGRYAEPEAADVNVSDLPEPDVEPGIADQLGRMHEALERMPFIEREVLVLFYLEELTLAQLAEVLAIPVGTVKSRLFRARTTLRNELSNSLSSHD